MLEVKFPGMTSAECFQWINDFSITHTLLRDNLQVYNNLSMTTYDVLVMDSKLKITYRGAAASGSTTRAEVMNALAALMP